MKKVLRFFKPSKKKIILLVIILIIGAVTFFNLNKQPETIETAKVTPQDIKETVSASGILTGKEEVNLKFKLSGRLAYINVKDGDTVKAGQTIAGLDTQDLQIALTQAQRDYEAKHAAAQNAEDQVKDNDGDENFTQKELRTKAQAAQNIAFDEVKARQRDFQDAVITSPISGIVTQTDVIAGQNVSPSDVIAQIVNEGDFYFDAEVDESDIGRVSVGQTAEISINSYPDKTFVGTVEKINPQTKETDTGATIVVVKINMGKPDINFVSGINGQAEIIEKETQNSLSIPSESLVNDNQVYVKQGDNWVTKKVTIGLTDGTNTEIKSGLSEGDIVATNPEVAKKQLSSQNPITKLFKR